MAILQIGEDWRITSDPQCWILQKRSVTQNSDIPENIGKERWDNEGYYTTLPAAIKGLVDRDIRTPAEIQGMLDRLKELYQLIDERTANVKELIPVGRLPKEKATETDDDLEDFLS